jgi:hypothetical protein
LSNVNKVAVLETGSAVKGFGVARGWESGFGRDEDDSFVNE